jgi:hypothetical protein
VGPAEEGTAVVSCGKEIGSSTSDEESELVLLGVERGAGGFTFTAVLEVSNNFTTSAVITE